MIYITVVAWDGMGRIAKAERFTDVLEAYRLRNHALLLTEPDGETLRYPDAFVAEIDVSTFMEDLRVVNGELVIDPAPTPPATIPQVVTRRQARLALAQVGLLATVEAHIATQSQVVQINWADATEFRRDNEILLAAAAALEMTEQQVDDLYTLAGSF